MELDGSPRQRHELLTDCEVKLQQLALSNAESIRTQVRCPIEAATADAIAVYVLVRCCEAFWFPPQALQESMGSMVGSVKQALANRESLQLSARASMEDALAQLQVSPCISQVVCVPRCSSFPINGEQEENRALKAQLGTAVSQADSTAESLQVCCLRAPRRNLVVSADSNSDRGPLHTRSHLSCTNASRRPAPEHAQSHERPDLWAPTPQRLILRCNTSA